MIEKCGLLEVNVSFRNSLESFQAKLVDKVSSLAL